MDNVSVVRRFYEEMCNKRRNDIAGEIFTDEHQMHDPQTPARVGPAGMAAIVSTYQDGVTGHWNIEEIFEVGERVVVRWTGSGKHVGIINGIPPTGREVRVEAISIHRMENGKIAETWEVWDTLGMLQQIGVMPAPLAERAGVA